MTTRWYRRQLLLLLGTALLLLALFETTALDLRLSAYFYDGSLGDFPWRRHWLFESLLHHGLKSISYILGAAALYFCLLGYLGELPWLPRRNALLAALGMLLIPLTTTLLKVLTHRHCPWDVLDFGGFAPYQSLLTPPQEGIKAGQCFPAGHASAGFLWIVWAIALRPAGQRWARRALSISLALGFLMGLGRLIQGAHFLSHTLWSLWFAWAISLGLAALLRAELALPAPRPGTRALQYRPSPTPSTPP